MFKKGEKAESGVKVSKWIIGGAGTKTYDPDLNAKPCEYKAEGDEYTTYSGTPTCIDAILLTATGALYQKIGIAAMTVATVLANM
jgi:hypothetical protein